MANILSCPVPSNMNPLSPTGFMFNIQKLPEVSYFCQEVNLPELSLGVFEVNNPLSSKAMPGEMLSFGQLNVQFLIDENMTNYKAIHNWLVGLGFPESWDQYQNFINQDNRGVRSDGLKNFSDATLTILGANNSAVQTVQFIDLFPVSLESLTFVSTAQDVQYLIGSAAFRYNQYRFV